MTKPLTLTMAAAAGALLFGGAASAQNIRIENAIARVVYIPEDRSDVAVEVQNGNAALPALEVTRDQRGVHIGGNLRRNGLRGRSLSCDSGSRRSGPPTTPGEGAFVTTTGVGRIALSDAPLVVIRGPRNAHIGADGAVHGAIGRGANNVRLASAGCGNWVVANVAGDTDLAIGGSGDIWTGSADNLKVSIGGSGDVRATSVRDLSVSIAGSGDVTVQRANGDVAISIAGSGGVDVADGQIDALNVNVMGSGEVQVGGVVRDVAANVAGSGDIVVARVTGNVTQRAMGSGKVRVLNRN